MARPRNPYAAPSVPPTYQIPGGSSSSGMPTVPNPATPQLGSYGGVNGYNTPNVNTYVAPGGRFASGLGDNTPGLSRQIAAHHHQQMLNGLSASDAKQLRLGGAKPEQPFSMAAPPTLDSTSRFATPRGVNFNPTTGSTYFRNGNGSGIIGAGATAALEAQGIRPTDLNPNSPYNGQARDALRKITQDSESRLAAERTAAGGGLSLSGKNRQRERDVLARRGMIRNPGAPLGANAQDMMNRRAATASVNTQGNNRTAVHQELYNQALKAHLATMSPQQQMAFLQQQLGGSQPFTPAAQPGAAPATRPVGPLGIGLGGPGELQPFPDVLPTTPPIGNGGAPPQWRGGASGFGGPVLPGRRYGGF